MRYLIIDHSIIKLIKLSQEKVFYFFILDNYKYQCINQCNERIRTNLQPTLEKMLKKNFKERPTL